MIANFIFTEVQNHFPKLTISDIRIDTPPKWMPWHYTLNVFSLAGKCQKAPDVLAWEIGDMLSSHTYVVSTDAVKGFLNITFSDAFFLRLLEEFSPMQPKSKDETVIVDYIGINIGKQMHVGHICTAVFGQVIINHLRYQGYDVISDMHQGDWGIIFGKLLTAWEKYGDEEAFTANPVEYLLSLYVRISQEAKKDEAVEQLTRDTFLKLSQWDEQLVQLWKKFTHESLSAVKATLKELHIQYDHAIGESFYEWLGLPKATNHPDLDEEGTMSYIVEELIKKWIATKNEDKSVWVEFPKASKLPSTILQKRDGANMYMTSDLATLKYRSVHWHPTKNIVCTWSEQRLHFQQVYSIAQRAWWGYENAELVHVMNGLVKLPEGKISSREGNTIPLDQLVSQWVERANKILIEKGRALNPEDVRAISVWAIKYAFLSQDRSKDIVFTWDKALAFEGNSGPYIQYAVVRMKKMIWEDVSIEKSSWNSNVQLTKHDIQLIQDLHAWQDVLDSCGQSYKYHSLAQYCYDVATHINAMYSNVGSIMEDTDMARKSLRVSLISEIVSVIEASFSLLWLPIPEEM